MFDARLKRNKCRCLNNKPWQECDGWSDMSQCMFGAPIGISFPHFFNSPRRQREVNGLNPNADLHFGFLDMEPQLAVPVSAKLVFQGVLGVTPISSVSALSQLPNVKLPLVWVEMVCLLVKNYNNLRLVHSRITKN